MSRRETLAYVAGSAAVAWAAAALLVAAGPGSDTMAKVYPAFQPLLETLDLEHDWGFFAPDPGTGHVVRYEIRDAKGKKHAFRLTEELERWSPAYFRFTTLYTNASHSDSDYAPAATRRLCHRHADLDPVKFRFVVAHQQAVSAEEFRDGVDPMDDLTISPRSWQPCPEDE